MLSFYALALCALIVLVLPSYSLLRVLGFSRTLVFIYAPCVSLAVFSLLGVLFGFFEIAITPWIFFALAAIALSACSPLVFVLCRALSKNLLVEDRAPCTQDSSCEPSFNNSLRPKLLLLYVAVSCVVGSMLYVSQIDGGYAIAQGWDMFWHVDLIRFFIDTGSISSLKTAAFLPGEQAPYAPGGFYPALWHAYAAALASLLNCGVDYALNACNFVLMCVVFPGGMYALMNVLVPSNARTQVCGAFICPAFGAFPWKLLTYGPLLPQLAANCFIPGLLALAIVLIRACMARRGSQEAGRRALGVGGCLPLVPCAIVALSGIVTLAFMQTAAVFSVFLFAFPLCVRLIYVLLKSVSEPLRAKPPFNKLKSRPAKILLLGLSVVLCALVWIGLHYVPGIFYVVFGPWPWAPYLSVEEAFGRLVRLSFDEYYAQYVLTFLVCLGLGLCIKTKFLRWYAGTAVLVIIQYLLVTSTSDLPRVLTSGFWYTDPARIAAHCALVFMPLASIGLAFVLDSVAPFATRKTSRAFNQRDISLVLGAAIVLLVYAPSFQLGSLYIHNYRGVVLEQIGHVYSEEVKFYTKDDRDFLARQRDRFEEGYLILNIPQDGSAFAFGLDNIPVQYRSTNDIGKDETDNSRTLRTRLDKLAQDPRVQKAVRENKIRYVLRLDDFSLNEEGEYVDPQGESSVTSIRWDPFLYKGILAVNASTPGFKLLVSEGHRTIYEIDSSYLEESR